MTRVVSVRLGLLAGAGKLLRSSPDFSGNDWHMLPRMVAIVATDLADIDRVL